MEVSHQCRLRGIALRANWVPRLENQEADDLTNMEFKAFDMRNRIDVDLNDLNFGVLRELFEVGDAYVSELEAQKAAHKAASSEGEAKQRRKADDLLRVKDPW